MERGRPTIYSPEVISQFLERMANGESVRSICRDDKMPALATIFRWLGEKPDFKEQYARAREMQADALFEELQEVAEEALKAETAVEVNARRLIVDTHKWRLSKIVPKRYGDKLELSGDQNNPLQHNLTVNFVKPDGKSS